MPQPNKIPLAFAASGDKNAIPESTETTGLASWREGFPAITSAPFSEGGIAPKRADFNGIFNALSQAVLWMQQGGVYAYDADTDYEAGNVVLDAGGLYVANAANGPSSAVVQPSSDTTGATWKLVRLDLATQIAAGYMSAEDKAKLDGVAATYLPLAGGTMTGDVKYISPVTRGTATAQAVERYFFDNIDVNGVRLAAGEAVIYPDKSSRIALYAYNTTIPSGFYIGRLSIGCDSNGNVFTEAPTPATADVSTKIATTEYVDAHASNVQVKTLSPTSAVTTPHYSGCVVQNHVCFVDLSFSLAATPALWTTIKIFDLPVTPTKTVSGLLNNQIGSVGGMFIEARTDGGLYMRFTGGSLPTNDYYHGGIVFPC